MDLSRLEALAKEITPGPLRLELDGTGHCCLRAPHQVGRTVARVFCEIDAEFIEVCWEGVPALLAELARLKALNEGLAERVAAQSEILRRSAERRGAS